MLRSIRLVFGLVLGVTAIAHGQGQRPWRQVYRDTGMTVALDTGRVAHARDGSHTVVLRWNYSRPRAAENRRLYTRMIQQVQVRCSPAPIRVKRFANAVYSASGVLVEEAKPLTAAQLRNMDWGGVPDGSDGARVYPALCRILAQSSQRGRRAS